LYILCKRKLAGVAVLERLTCNERKKIHTQHTKYVYVKDAAIVFKHQSHFYNVRLQCTWYE